MSILALMKIAGAAPAAAPAPPPNKVNAPSITPRGPAAPKVTPSSPDGSSAAYQATPLGAPGLGVVHGGMAMTAAQQQTVQQEEALAAIEAEKNKPKAEKAPAPVKQDTVLSSQLLARWNEQLDDVASIKGNKMASDPRAQSVRKFDGGNTSHYDVSQIGGMAGGMPSFAPPTPFTPGTTPDKLWSMGRTLLTNSVTNKKPQGGILNDDLRWAPPSAYKTQLAQSLADPIATGNGGNPLINAGAQLLGNWLGGKAPSADQMQDMGNQLQDNFR